MSQAAAAAQAVPLNAQVEMYAVQLAALGFVIVSVQAFTIQVVPLNPQVGR